MDATDCAFLTFIGLFLLLMAIGWDWKATLTFVGMILLFVFSIMGLTLFYQWLGFP